LTEALVDLARMHKAISILQFKLEGQLLDRRPEWQLGHRALLRRIDPVAGTVDIDGVRYPAARHPVPDRRLERSVQAVRRRGPLPGRADRRVHVEPDAVEPDGVRGLARPDWRCAATCARSSTGCVPVDDAGEPLAMVVDGEPAARQGAVRRVRARESSARSTARCARGSTRSPSSTAT